VRTARENPARLTISSDPSKRKNALQEDLIVQQVVQLRTQLPGVGTGKLQHLLSGFLADHHVKLGRDKLYDLLRAHHLLRYKRRKRAQTTNSQHPFYKYENLVRRLLPPDYGLCAGAHLTHQRSPISPANGRQV
jgi:hypothetical protein